MEIEALDRIRIHHGHNIRRLRIEKKISQGVLADKVSLSQQTISRYESSRVIDDEMLDRFAKALEVPVDLIKTIEEDSEVNFFIENNTFHANCHISPFSRDTNVNNLVKEIIDLCNEKTALYERILASEKEKVRMLEKILKKEKIIFDE